MKRPKFCSLCGEEFNEEEVEDPYMEDGEAICDNCYHDLNAFECCWCGEYDDIENQHNMIVVFDAKAARLNQPGVYRVSGNPYYRHSVLGEGEIIKHAVERIADVSSDMDGDGYPCGHLCLQCQNEIIEAMKIGG